MFPLKHVFSRINYKLLYSSDTLRISKSRKNSQLFDEFLYYGLKKQKEIYSEMYIVYKRILH